MRFAIFPALILLTLSAPLRAEDTSRSDADAEKLFAVKILPLLKQKCFACHGEDPQGKLKGDLDLRTRDSMLKGGESGEASVVPHKPADSVLYQSIRWESYEMPPKENDRLNETQIGYFKQWIEAGAPWPDAKRLAELQKEDWENAEGVTVVTSGGQSADWTNRKYNPDDLWAFQPLQKPEVPDLKSRRSTAPVDAFLEQKLHETGIPPAKRAGKLTLIRRATYDLTGLPPTPAEVQQFLQDDSPEAFKKLIDRLLDSPAYGEQMARHWLDVVRYADTAGFSNDFERPNAWRYRDYVIRAFNNDKPYDVFLTEQLAGDEILTLRQKSEAGNPDKQAFIATNNFDITPHAQTSDSELLIATGYLRMGPWEHTGMSVLAVTRQQYLDDIVNNVGETFLATTLRCCKCHDHKFDPLPTLDYYRMQAIFAPVQFAERDAPFDAWENVEGTQAKRKRIERLIEDPGISLHIHENATQQEIDDAMKGINKVLKKQKSIRERQQYRYDPLAFSVYDGPLDEKYRSNAARHPMPKQMKGDLQEVFLLKGGSIESPVKEVTPGVLTALPNSNDLISPNDRNQIPESMYGRRLALARWIGSPDNPLTARVIANRVWQWHFGNALAGNPNNFGKTGKRPTHPELLDYLAISLIENGWSLKALHREIMLSDAYQRAGQPVDAEQVAKSDPSNSLLSWFPPRRLSSEEIRDSMLAISGELNREMGGVPIRPEINREVAFQPRHVMGSVAPAYQPSRTPDERNRRTIYALKIRTLRDPMMEVFDQPNADNSCERRTESTVTPQVFNLFNSQNSHDRALAMAVHLSQESPHLNDRLERAFLLSYGRKPTAGEQRACRAHVQQLTKHYQATPIESRTDPPFIIREMVEEMTGKDFFWKEELDIYQNYVPDVRPADVTPEVQALADLCLVLMNSNEFLYVY